MVAGRRPINVEEIEHGADAAKVVMFILLLFECIQFYGMAWGWWNKLEDTLPVQ